MKKLNLYFILSETMRHDYYNDYDPPEYYRVCEFVQAENVSKAKIKAMKEEKLYDFHDWPKLFTQTLAKGFVTKPRIVTCEKSWEGFWKDIDFHKEKMFMERNP